jgi:hypothetical protein
MKQWILEIMGQVLFLLRQNCSVWTFNFMFEMFVLSLSALSGNFDDSGVNYKVRKCQVFKLGQFHGQFRKKFREQFQWTILGKNFRTIFGTISETILWTIFGTILETILEMILGTTSGAITEAISGTSLEGNLRANFGDNSDDIFWKYLGDNFGDIFETF